MVLQDVCGTDTNEVGSYENVVLLQHSSGIGAK